jgi:predicted PP-loop superfamily ATPase
MEICTNCVLPSTFPGIYFNEQGICNFCGECKDKEKIAEEKKIYFDKFTALLEQVKGKSDYDCTLSYSGGKDSTYTLYLLREVFKLKVLALTFDNGFIPEQAFKNIRTVTENLGTDSIIFKANFQVMKKIFRTAVEKEMYSPKTLERASTICTSCIGLAKFSLLKIAMDKKVPIMVWGWTYGQAPIRSSIMKTNPSFFRATQDALRKPMEEAGGESVKRYFLSEEQFSNSDAFPYNASPLAFLDYNEKNILDKIAELGWKAPKEVDSNSTNCFLNSFANQFHVKKYGFHPYAFEIAGMVRSGLMPREEGLEKLNERENDDTVRLVKEKLGLP